MATNCKERYQRRFIQLVFMVELSSMLVLIPIKIHIQYVNNNNNLLYFDSLSGNKGLCGVPSLPSCPLLWENGHLSKGGKIAIAISCVVIFLVLLLVIYLCCIWRGRHDYDFAPPHDLTCEF